MVTENKYGLLGNVSWDRRKPVEVLVDDVTRSSIAGLQEEFEGYTPGKEMRTTDWRGLLTPKLAYFFRTQYGATLSATTELYGLFTRQRSGTTFDSLTKGQRTAIAQTFHSIGRAGVETVGTLREADIAALSKSPRIFIPPRSLVFAQTAVKKLA